MTDHVATGPMPADSPYDGVADLYADLFADPTLASEPGDRKILDRFIARVLTSPQRRCADLGCGPGHASAYLARAGLDVIGLDLSVPMITIAQRSCTDPDLPGLAFAVGSLSALPLADGCLDGALVRFSIIHTPPEQVPHQVAEVARVLRTFAAAVVSFQATDDPDTPVVGFDHRVAPAYRWHPDRMAALLAAAGLAEVDRLIVPAATTEGPHRFPEAHLMVGKDAA